MSAPTRDPEALAPEERAILADLTAEAAALLEKYHVAEYQAALEAAQERAIERLGALREGVA